MTKRKILRSALAVGIAGGALLIGASLVAQGTNSPSQAPASYRVESLRELTPAEAAAVPRGEPMLNHLGVRDLNVLFDGQNLALTGVGLLDNHDALPQRLAWSVRIAEPWKRGEDPRDREVLYEQPYAHQAFDLVPGTSARPTFADMLTLPGPLPTGRYSVELAIVDAAGKVKASAGKIVEVE